MDEKLRCPACLRQFGSATALVQHAESQAVICRIRESDEFRHAVDQMTGGFVGTDGRHNDRTIRYEALAISGADDLTSPTTRHSKVAKANKDYFEKAYEDREALIKKQNEHAEW